MLGAAPAVRAEQRCHGVMIAEGAAVCKGDVASSLTTDGRADKRMNSVLPHPFICSLSVDRLCALRMSARRAGVSHGGGVGRDVRRRRGRRNMGVVPACGGQALPPSRPRKVTEIQGDTP